jgi:hypothetical protein
VYKIGQLLYICAAASHGGSVGLTRETYFLRGCGMQQNRFWQAALTVATILLVLNAISPWRLTPTSSHGARPTEYKVVSLLEISLRAPQGDVMHTPIGHLARDKAKAVAEGLQQTLNEYAKDGWEVHTIDVSAGMLVLKK